MRHIEVRRSTYLDSYKLALISKRIKALSGIRDTVIAMGTDNVVLLLKEAGYDLSRTPGISAHDLVTAVDADDEQARAAALNLLSSEIEGIRREIVGQSSLPRSLDGALKQHPDINLVLISIPGQFAVYEAQRAIMNGKHVMVVGDNVPIEDEKCLKTLAAERGLLFMGPDCGTAMLNGVGLGFANTVSRGNIGIISASGTGAQEVTSILGRHKVGVSHVIGTGARDLSHVIGGMATVSGLRTLIADDDSQVIVLISKVADEEACGRILREAKLSWKWCIVYFAGWSRRDREDNLIFADTLAQAAFEAARAVGREYKPVLPFSDEIRKTLAEYKAALTLRRRYLRGLFCGGTLAQEAIFILGPALTSIRTNMEIPGFPLLGNPRQSQGHTILDMGDDAFIRGSAHPLIDQANRLRRLGSEVDDPETAVVLLDIVLGNGCSQDPGGEVARTLVKAYDTGEARPGSPIVIASICGTHKDPQDYFRQREVLERAGVIIADTNAGACELALEALSGR
jgi:FdrA protein